MPPTLQRNIEDESYLNDIVRKFQHMGHRYSGQFGNLSKPMKSSQRRNELQRNESDIYPYFDLNEKKVQQFIYDAVLKDGSTEQLNLHKTIKEFRNYGQQSTQFGYQYRNSNRKFPFIVEVKHEQTNIIPQKMQNKTRNNNSNQYNEGQSCQSLTHSIQKSKK